MKKRSLFGIALLLSCALGAAPALADRAKDESGKGRYRRHYKHSEGNEEFWHGHCKVERKWKRDGEYKEVRKCRGASHAHGPYGAAEPAAEPSVVITLPPLPNSSTGAADGRLRRLEIARQAPAY